MFNANRGGNPEETGVEYIVKYHLSLFLSLAFSDFSFILPFYCNNIVASLLSFILYAILFLLSHPHYHIIALVLHLFLAFILFSYSILCDVAKFLHIIRGLLGGIGGIGWLPRVISLI